MNIEEQQQLVEYLKKLKPGFLPHDIFVQIARLTVMPIVEFVPLRFKDNQVEVLLIERSEDDTIWPGEVHTPGTVIRATDNKGETYMAFERILKDELQGTKVSAPHFVSNIFHTGKRGAEQGQVFWVEVLEEPKVGQFYPATDLPDNLIESQKEFIQQAVQSYTMNRTKKS